MSWPDPRALPAEALYTLLAIVGGVANYLSTYLRGAEFDLRHLLAHAFVSGFSGLMFAQFAGFLGWTGEVQFMFAGLGGFMGTKAVEHIAERILERTTTEKEPPNAHPSEKQARRRAAKRRPQAAGRVAARGHLSKGL